jgi:hypothetical protein
VIKKLIVTALAGLLGLGMTAGPAHAADDPYVASVATHCDTGSVQAIKRGNSFVTHVEIRANGNREPRGEVKLTYTRVGGGFSASDTARYPGHAIDVAGPVLTKLGRYKVSSEFTPNDGSRFRGCTASFTLGVRNGVGPNDGGDDPGTKPDDGNGILPGTGGPDLMWLLLALSLVGSGAGVVYVDRRRRQAATA